MRYEKEYLDKIGLKVSHTICENTMAPIVTFEFNNIKSILKMTRVDLENFMSGSPYSDIIEGKINQHITELIKLVRKEKIDNINDKI